MKELIPKFEKQGVLVHPETKQKWDIEKELGPLLYGDWDPETKETKEPSPTGAAIGLRMWRVICFYIAMPRDATSAFSWTKEYMGFHLLFRYIGLFLGPEHTAINWEAINFLLNFKSDKPAHISFDRFLLREGEPEWHLKLLKI